MVNESMRKHYLWAGVAWFFLFQVIHTASEILNPTNYEQYSATTIFLALLITHGGLQIYPSYRLIKKSFGDFRNTSQGDTQSS